MKKLLLYFLISFVCLIGIVFSSILIKNNLFSSKKVEYTNSFQPTRSIHVSEKTFVQEITIAAVGDILIHDRVYLDAKQGDSYDFKPMLEAVKKNMLEPDILLANQETIVAGKSIGLSSYPSFNSPHEIADALVDAGVDIVTTANNHALDRGVNAQILSLDYLKKIKLPYVGTYSSPKDQQTLRIIEEKGMKIAFLSYTFGLNGIQVPKGKEFIVNLIDREKMKEEIARAKKVSDIVVMGIHWGNEYQRFPTIEQKELAQFLVDEGVNIIFGGHSHVLQPMEWLENKQGEKALVVYSLGNFLSGQSTNYKDIGGIASIKVKKYVIGNQDDIKLESPNFFPTYVTSKNQKNYKMVPLEKADEYGLPKAKKIYNEISNHMLKALK
jgi:poly-gamma-glutamate synthesis protein (capsule biosynthesis protein)